MNISPRYQEERSELEWGTILSHKRDIGESTYFFVAVVYSDSTIIQASREIRTFENVHGIYHHHPKEGDFGWHPRDDCPDNGICQLHAVT